MNFHKHLIAALLLLFVSCSIAKEGTKVSTNQLRSDVPERWSFLSAIELPANSAVAESVTFVDEKFGTTKASVYSTSNPMQKLVVHTFASGNGEKRNFTLLMDGNLRCAVWVACAMHSTGFADNKVGRVDGWAYDPAIPQDWQFNGKYTESKIYDRGHQVASNDRQTTIEENRQTFYYSNMTPQFGLLNRGQWKKLEDDVQTAGAATGGQDTLYVVTGPIFNKEIRYTTDKAGARLAVPEGYFKCLLKCSFDSNGKPVKATGSAFIFNSNSSNVEPSHTTIDAVETLTGLDLYSNLPDDIENQAESMMMKFW